MKTTAAVVIAAFSTSLLISCLVPPVATADEIDYGAAEGLLPSTAEMSQWVDQLSALGIHSRYGYRMPGTGPDTKGGYYVLDKFNEFGLEDTFLEPVPATFSFPDSWGLKIRAKGKLENIGSYFLRYAAFTPPQGIKAPLVYVGTGSAAEFDAAGDVSGKIVLVDIIAPPITVASLAPATLFKYDPANTLVGENATENWPPINFDSSYALAGDRGAVGYIAVITFMARDN